MLGRPQVHKTVAGATVESPHRAAWFEYRNVGDAADIDHNTRLGRRSEHAIVKGRCHWRPLPPAGDVAGAKVRDNIDAGAFGQQCRIVELRGKAEIRSVSNGLPVAADRANLATINSRRVHRLVHENSIDLR